MNILKSNKGLIDHLVGGFWWGVMIYWLALIFNCNDIVFYGAITGIILGLGYEMYQWVMYEGKEYKALFLDSLEDFTGEVLTGVVGVMIAYLINTGLESIRNEIYLGLTLAGSAWLVYSWFFRWKK